MERDQLRADQALSMARSGRVSAAIRLANDVVAKATLAAPVHYELARVYAVASVAGDDKASLEPNTRATWTESLAEQAMTHLKSVQRRGFFGDPKQVLRLSAIPNGPSSGLAPVSGRFVKSGLSNQCVRR